MEKDAWVMRYLQQAQEEASKYPEWTRAISDAVDSYYGRNTLRGLAHPQNCNAVAEKDDGVVKTAS